MKNILRIDHANAKIIMDREFAIKSAIFGTEEYKHLQEARRDYDGYAVVRKTIRTNSKKESFNGLTYEYMEKYMVRYNIPEELRKEYEELRFMAKCHSIRYPVIKKWFLNTFPDVKDWGKTKEKLDAATAA